jgi:hypothetical protein
MNPRDLTEKIIIEAMCEMEPMHYRDFADFAQDCHAVSLTLVRSGLLGTGGPDLRVARGACLGVGGQHSWVVLGHPYDPTATIVDLTLWSYNPTQPRIWVGTMRDGLHRPKGYGHILQGVKPGTRGGEVIQVEVSSRDARDFLRMVGPLDARGWAGLWSHCGMLGWPAKEILEALLDQHPQMTALVPIDIVGMITDRNPENIYW